MQQGGNSHGRILTAQKPCSRKVIRTRRVYSSSGAIGSSHRTFPRQPSTTRRHDYRQTGFRGTRDFRGSEGHAPGVALSTRLRGRAVRPSVFARHPISSKANSPQEDPWCSDRRHSEELHLRKLSLLVSHRILSQDRQSGHVKPLAR